MKVLKRLERISFWELNANKIISVLPLIWQIDWISKKDLEAFTKKDKLR